LKTSSIPWDFFSLVVDRMNGVFVSEQKGEQPSCLCNDEEILVIQGQVWFSNKEVAALCKNKPYLYHVYVSIINASSLIMAGLTLLQCLILKSTLTLVIGLGQVASKCVCILWTIHRTTFCTISFTYLSLFRITLTVSLMLNIHYTSLHFAFDMFSNHSWSNCSHFRNVKK